MLEFVGRARGVSGEGLTASQKREKRKKERERERECGASKLRSNRDRVMTVAKRASQS